MKNKTNWKPEIGEKYWVIVLNRLCVEEYKCINDWTERWLSEMGNQYKTKSEALEKLELIKKVLKS